MENQHLDSISMCYTENAFTLSDYNNWRFQCKFLNKNNSIINITKLMDKYNIKLVFFFTQINHTWTNASI